MRLVAPGLDRLWSSDAPAPTSADAAAQLNRLNAAARWIGENLRALGAPRLDALCVDPDGAVCTWLTAASPDEKVVAATLTQASLSTGDGIAAVGPSSGGGAAGRLAMLASSDPATATSELTLQPLAVAASHGPAAGGVRRGRSSTPSQAPGRFALLSIPDACVRVLIDALDDLGIEIGSVTSLWHALAAAFDPSAAARPGAEEPGVVANSDPATAVLMVDPAGRIVWAWSRAGMLVAGGALRLRLLTPPRQDADAASPAPDDPAATTIAPDADAATPPLTARRLNAAVERDDEPLPEASTAEVGRLVADWLAWSAQLGSAPQRVVCFGPPTLPRAGDDPAHPSFAQALAKAWPGATVDRVEHDDPVGLTLQRLSAGSGAPAPSRRDAAADDDRLAGDPRLALTALSNRPGRAHRRMNRWAALSVLVFAAFVAMWGFQLHRAAGRADDAIERTREDRKQILAELEPLIPTIARESNPERVLTSRLNVLDEQARQVRPAPPLIGEVVRVLNAIATVQADLPEDRREQLKIRDFSVSSLGSTVRLEVPDSETGPRVEIALRATPGTMRWTGTTPPIRSGAQQLYVLTALPSGEQGGRP